MKALLLQMTGISKSFPGVKALDQVDFRVYEGRAMALLGENGAGKSTLMKILSGVYSKDEGSMQLQGEDYVVHKPAEASKAGIAIIHQELNLIPYLSVFENIFLGREKTKQGRLDKAEMIRETQELLARLSVDIRPTQRVHTLSIAQQQMVEIARALSMNARIIIMDEPTDTLTDKEVESLFTMIHELKRQNKGIVYISHRLQEIFEVCEELTVLRDGKFIAEKAVSEVDEAEIIRLMVGRPLKEQFPYQNRVQEQEVLRVEKLSNEYLQEVSFTLKKGEILGVSGLVGAGRTELAKTLYGVFPVQSGKIILKDREVCLRRPEQALRQGIAYVSEDRKYDGLVLGMSVRDNITLSALKQFRGPMGLNKQQEYHTAEEYRKAMNIKTPSLSQQVKFLSGGNQQKVALAKSLLVDPEVLILDEPTRGVDVGAKREIYDLLNNIVKQGKSIIMISSEMPELLGMCDRIMVMQQGKNKGILEREEATQEKIMSLIMKEEGSYE